MKDGNSIRLHMVGNAHIDPVWLWRWQEGFAETKATFRSALDRLEEFPDFVFTAAGAQSYRWIEENAPDMFREIVERVAEGRWAIVGGWWVQPDCNLPGGESFARHGLLSQRYFRSRFGRMARTGYNVDSFGHNAMLPQICLLSGLTAYVFLRPQEHELPLPAHLFQWEGADGSRIPTHRIAMNYASWWGEAEPVVEKMELGKKLALEEKTPLMVFYGVGNHGGGPTIRSLRTIQQLQASGFTPEAVFSSPDQYFDAVRPLVPGLPVHRGALQHHASGCYAAHSETKRDNRRAEHRLLAAESMSSLAVALLKAPYPYQEIRTGWEKLLFNQFHDALGGCGSPSALVDLREFFGLSLTLASESLNQALQRMSWAIDTSGGAPHSTSRDRDWVLWEVAGRGAPVVVFNTTAWPVEAPVRIGRRLSCVVDPEGNSLPFQHVRGDRLSAANKWDTLFSACIPALGYRVFWVSSADATPNPASPEPVLPTPPFFLPRAEPEAFTIANPYLEVRFDPAQGGLCGLKLKSSGLSVLSSSAAAVVVDESGYDTWGHDMKSHQNTLHRYRDDLGRFGEDGSVEVMLLQSGPVRTTVRVTSRWGRSVLRQDYHLDAQADFLEVDTRVDWREERKRLSLSFPVAISAPRALYEIPYGFVERTPNGDEEAGQRWVDVSGRSAAAGKGATIGLTLFSADRNSFSTEGPDLRLTLVRSAPYASYEGTLDEFSEYMDQGLHDLRYQLHPHDGAVAPSDAFRRATQLCQPPVHILETFHKGPLPLIFEGISVSDPAIAVTAFKRSEDEDAYILRCHETDGVARTGTISLAAPDRMLEADFTPFGIRTFRIPDDPRQPVEAVDLLELPLLPQDERRNP